MVSLIIASVKELRAVGKMATIASSTLCASNECIILGELRVVLVVLESHCD